MKIPDINNVQVQNNVIEVTHAPTGCMLIKRSVFDKLKKLILIKVLNKVPLLMVKWKIKKKCGISLIPYTTLYLRFIWGKTLLSVSFGKI
jgi:hypothetical protein